MSDIKKINVGGTEYDILPPGGTDGQALVIENGQPAWGSAGLVWEEI